MRSLAFMLLLVSSIAQAESALTNRATDLMAQAQSDAVKVSSLSENTKLDVLRRSGAWTEVKTAAGQTGWVRMMHLKSETTAASGSTASGTLANLLSSGRTSNNATVTTGVRGLQEADLQRAQPNPNEFHKMQRNAVSKDMAHVFAQRSKLTASRVDYLENQSAAPVAAPGNDVTPGIGG